MEIAFLHFFGGILLLYLGGNFLVSGSAGLAANLGIRPLVAGLTIVAFATSVPELAVTPDAAIEGYSDVAVGTVAGSNICNIALILGLSALIAPVRVDPQVFRVDIPIMLASSALLVALLLDDRLTRAEGVLLILGILAYVSLHHSPSSEKRVRTERGPQSGHRDPPDPRPITTGAMDDAVRRGGQLLGENLEGVTRVRQSVLPVGGKATSPAPHCHNRVAKLPIIDQRPHLCVVRAAILADAEAPRLLDSSAVVGVFPDQLDELLNLAPFPCARRLRGDADQQSQHPEDHE